MSKQNLLNRREFLALSAAATGLGAPSRRRPNILLIVADDLGLQRSWLLWRRDRHADLNRWRPTDCDSRSSTPPPDAVPRGRAFSPGSTPHKVGVGHMVTDLGHPGYRGRLSENAATIAEVLRPAGYRTFMSGKWHVGTNDPTRHGFEQFYGTLISAQSFWDSAQYLRLPQGSSTRSYDTDTFYGTDALTDHALDFLADARTTPDQPWFLYLAFHAPHFPLHARREDIAKYQAPVHGRDGTCLRQERLARMKRLRLVSAKHEPVAALAVHQSRRDRHRRESAVGQPSRRPAARISRCAWRSTRR